MGKHKNETHIVVDAAAFGTAIKLLYIGVLIGIGAFSLEKAGAVLGVYEQRAAPVVEGSPSRPAAFRYLRAGSRELHCTCSDSTTTATAEGPAHYAPTSARPADGGE